MFPGRESLSILGLVSRKQKSNGRRVNACCTERGLRVGNTYVKHESSHKYSVVAGGQEGMEVISLIDLVLGKKDMCRTWDHTVDLFCPRSTRNSILPVCSLLVELSLKFLYFIN